MVQYKVVRVLTKLCKLVMRHFSSATLGQKLADFSERSSWPLVLIESTVNIFKS